MGKKKQWKFAPSSGARDLSSLRQRPLRRRAVAIYTTTFRGGIAAAAAQSENVSARALHARSVVRVRVCAHVGGVTEWNRRVRRRQSRMPPPPRARIHGDAAGRHGACTRVVDVDKWWTSWAGAVVRPPPPPHPCAPRPGAAKSRLCPAPPSTAIRARGRTHTHTRAHIHNIYTARRRRCYHSSTTRLRVCVYIYIVRIKWQQTDTHTQTKSGKIKVRALRLYVCVSVWLYVCARDSWAYDIYKLTAETTVVPLLPPALRYIYTWPPKLSFVLQLALHARRTKNFRIASAAAAAHSFPRRFGVRIYIYIYVFPSRVPRRRVGGRASWEGVYTSVLARAPYNIYILYSLRTTRDRIYIYIYMYVHAKAKVNGEKCISLNNIYIYIYARLL